ncbi:MAG: RNB domain-containing ribonuclease, partial [Alphaproteobacteria bacterium]
MAKRRRTPAPLPSKEDILRFIRESPDRVGRREIARAFHLTGSARAVLGGILSALEREGHFGRRRRSATAGTLPRVAVIEVTGTDADGEVLGRPVKWPEDVEPPKIYLAPDRHGLPTLGQGERVLARLEAAGEGAYEAHTIRRIGVAPREVLGVYTLVGGRGRVVPADRRAKSEFIVEEGDSAGASPGELVRARTLARRVLGLRQAEVIERIGSLDDAGALSLIAIHGHDIPTEFPAAALAQAAKARPAPLARRVDLGDVPLVTIDDEDARDFDDAVWAEPDPDTSGGWRLIVAIADVAYYVRAGDGLDQCAGERGNSVYLPDRVVPMLPERLSNGLCSLKPGEDRPCIAVHMWIDSDGKPKRHEFVRAMMRSAARLTYAQVQSARDGAPDDVSEPLLKTVIAPLYGAYEALRQARQKRGALDIELPE